MLPVMRTNLAFGLVAVSWGGSYVASKVGLADAGPFSFAMLTTLFGGLTVALVAWYRTRAVPRDLHAHGLAALLGLLNSTVFVGLLNLGLAARGMSAGMASILTYTQPLMVVVLARALLRERPGRRRLLGVVIGFAGMVIALGASIGTSLAPLWSYLCPLGAALSWALGTVLFKQIHARVDLLWTAALQGIYAAIPLGAIAYLTEGSAVAMHPTVPALLALAQVALFSSGVAMATYLYLLTRHATVKVGVYLFTVPLISVLLGVLLLHEPLPPSLALGGVGVLAGVYLSGAEPDQAQADGAAYRVTVAR